jgi:hypothetical protein
MQSRALADAVLSDGLFAAGISYYWSEPRADSSKMD